MKLKLNYSRSEVSETSETFISLQMLSYHVIDFMAITTAHVLIPARCCSTKRLVLYLSFPALLSVETVNVLSAIDELRPLK